MTNVCKNCESLQEYNEGGYYCGITCKNLETIKEQPKWCPLFRNCHEYCTYAKMCRYAKGSNGMNPYDCGTYYKLEDITNEARDIEREERMRREQEFEECEDW